MSNNFGKTSELILRTKSFNGETRLVDSFFTAPYKIAKPFYDEDKKLMKLMVMTASAGIMEGDCYGISIELQDKSRLALLGQSYNKIHKMKDRDASQENHFFLDEGAFFDYIQKPTIPFEDSSFKSSTVCHMKKDASFMYSEVLSCGREKMGESFLFRSFRNNFKVYYDEELIFMENQVLEPEKQQLQGIGYFEGFTHQATLGYFSEKVCDALLDEISKLIEGEEGMEYGISRTRKYGAVVRMLGRSSDSLEKKLESVRKYLYSLDS